MKRHRANTGCSLPIETIETIRTMRRNEASLAEIAQATGLKRNQIAHFLNRYGATYGIAVRTKAKNRQVSEFDKQWQGSVPYLHWTITKPWRIQE